MSDFDLCVCSRCQEALSTPIEIHNSPGLSAIAYRVGTYAQFRQSMLNRLKDVPGLQGLRTEKDQDFSIALFDAWAMVSDVLTFYQERIANESYRRTAKEPISLRELAHMVNYPLHPGVAANAYLAFTLEDTPGAPRQAIIDIGTRVQSLPEQNELPQIFETTEQIEARAAWNAIRPVATMKQQLTSTSTTVYLKGTSTNLRPGDALLIQVPGQTEPIFSHVKAVDLNNLAQQTVVTFTSMQPPTSVLSQPPASGARAGTSPAPTVFALRTHAALFGHNAADWRLLPEIVQRTYLDAYLRATRQRYVNLDTLTDWPATPSSLDLDLVYPQVVPGSWCVVIFPPSPARPNGLTVIAPVTEVTEASVMGYGMSAKVTRLKLDTTQPYIPATMDDIRQVVIYSQSEELPLAGDVPYDTPVQGDSIWVAGDIEEYKDLKGRMIVVRGEKDDSPGQVYNEPAVVSKVSTVTGDSEHSGQIYLQLKSGLGNSYKPGTVTINGNVVQATQGETIEDEILGSGDASQPYQSFTLRQSPLTYVQAADSVTGTASTLEVRVDGIPWKEVDKLSGHGPRERIYTTSIGDDGTVTVQFGDGLTAGSRLPTGEDNVHATYRKGIGQQALVNAGQLSILMTRPLGVKGVTNPFPATGAIDPETMEDARRNADNTVLTLGRIVSTEDYQNYAFSYTQVAKAQAKKCWNGSTWSMIVTIAGPTTPDMPYGTKIKEGDGYYERIHTGIYTWSDPTIPFLLQSYDPERDLLLFRIQARMKLNPAAPQDRVLKEVNSALLSQFSFVERDFGQGVSTEEVVAMIQKISDVVMVHVNGLSLVGAATSGADVGRAGDVARAGARPAPTIYEAGVGGVGARPGGTTPAPTMYEADQPRLRRDGSVSPAQLLLIDSQVPFEQLEVLP